MRSTRFTSSTLLNRTRSSAGLGISIVESFTLARAPEARVELRRNGRALTNVLVALGRADARGRIQELSRLPLQPLTDGTYELHVTVRDGRHTVERSAFFTVVD